MKKQEQKVYRWVFGLGLLLLPLASPVLGQERQAAIITLHVAEILPAELLSGPNYKVNDVVSNDGIINTYQLDTESGRIRVESSTLLDIRIRELNALDRMARLKGTQVYTDSVKKSGARPLEAAASMITSPIDTTKNMVSGIGRWFGDVGRAIISDDPHQEGALKTAVGFAAAKRKFAYEFGINPYSSFAPLQKELDDIAWTSVGGSLTVKVAFMAIPAPARTAVSLSGTAGGMKQLVRDNSPDQLEKINAEKLAAMGVAGATRQAFLANSAFDPQEKTLLVEALAQMKGVAERPAVIEAATPVSEGTLALYMRLRAQLMALYAAQHPVERVVDVARASFLRTTDGKLVGIFPLDYVRWTALVAEREQAISQALEAVYGNAVKEFWVSGTMDPEARKIFEEKGWRVRERVIQELLSAAS